MSSRFLGDNHSSDSSHTWTIDTLYGWLSFHGMGSLGPCQGVELEVLDFLEILQKNDFSVE